MNPGSEVFTVVLKKENQNQPWGFRLQGGCDFTTPLSIQSVSPGSVADRCGLRAEDAVLRINERSSEQLEHEEAKRMILLAGLEVTMEVQRGAVRIWKPKVTPLSELRPSGSDKPSLPQETNGNAGVRFSLAANKQEFTPIGSSHNRSARPFVGFGGGSSVPAPVPVHVQQPQAETQANSYGGQASASLQQQQQGAGQYSMQGSTASQQQQQSHAASSYQTQQQAGQEYGQPGLGSNMASEPRFSNQPIAGNEPTSMPSGIRSVRAPVAKPPSERSQNQQYMTCKLCDTLIVGVFVRASGDPIHPECFKCVSCAKNLKNQGHFTVSGKLYCDVCARTAAQPPAPDMYATPVYR